MRVAIYARKSTEGEDRQVQSISDQLRVMKEIARKDRLQIVEIIEESRSAKAPGSRPEFRKLLALANSERIDGVLTWSINRLSRNPVDGGEIAYLLQIGRLKFIQTAEKVYYPEDNALLLSIETGLATAYVQDLSRNVKRGLESRIARGWAVNKAPVGYLNNPVTGEIDIDPDRFQIMKEAWNLILDDAGPVSSVYRYVKARGLTVPNRRGVARDISRNGFYNLLHKRFYAGEITFRGQQYPGKHKAMITMAEFERARGLIRSNRILVTPKERSFPFTGVFRCEICGCAVVGEAKTKTYQRTGRTVEYVYYHCSGAKGCSKAGIRQEELANELNALRQTISVHPTLRTWLIEELVAFISNNESENKLSDLEKRKQVLAKRRKSLNALRLDGEITESEFHEIKNDLLADQVVIEKEEHSLRRLAQRLPERLDELMTAAVRAGEVADDGSNLAVTGAIVKRLGKHTLNLGRVTFNVHPVISALSKFEPPKESLRASNHGASYPSDSRWLSFVEELLNLLLVDYAQRIEDQRN